MPQSHDTGSGGDAAVAAQGVKGEGRHPRAERHCSVRKTVEIILDSWTFLIVREAFFGVRRFGKFQHRLGVPRQTLSNRLSMLVEDGIFVTRKQTGMRGHDYLLSVRGKDLFATMLALMEFGDAWLTADAPPPLSLVHTVCGHACHPRTVCDQCHAPVAASDVTFRNGPGAGLSPFKVRLHSRRSSDSALLERVRPCSVARSLQIIGDRWSFLILREGWFGVRRFDALMERLGIASNILADRLSRLVRAGVLRKVPYGPSGERHEYRFSQMGRDLYKPMIVMMQWGDRWLASGKPPLLLRHNSCNSDFRPVVVCSHCGGEITARETTYTLTYKLDD